MEFKVSASVWANPQESQMQSSLKSGFADFRDKLDLSGEEQFGRDTASKGSEQGPGIFSNEPAPDQMPGKHAELYSWGLEAGHHLSFRPGAEAQFVSSVYERNTPTAASAVLLPTPNVSMRPMGAVDAKMANDKPVSDLTSFEARSSTVEGGSAEAVLVGERLQQFLAQRWPPSRFSVIPGKNGIDVIIRDFYLSEAELQNLAKDLREKMQSSGTTPETIWINGHAIWQRDIMFRQVKELLHGY